MTDLGVPVANAAIAQAKGFLDAWLGPTIEKVAKSSRERAILNEVKSDSLNLALHRYLTRLIADSAEIQSIVFPGHKLPLERIYEPVFLEEDTMPPNRKQVDINLLAASKHHCTIIDAAGMGKTTFARQMILHLCQVSEQIPIYFI